MKNDELVVNGPCWVELSTSDAASATTFYTGLFGWRAETDPRPEAGGYTMLSLADGPVAALAPQYQEGRPTAWLVSFQVASADGMADQVREAGGTVQLGPMDVFELGRFAVCADPAGAVFSIWEPKDFRGAAVVNRPNSLGWVELHTRDVAACTAFYPRVFGWSVSPSEYYTQWGLGGADFGGMARLDESLPPEVPPHWLPYFSVADVDATVHKAVGHGAERVMGPADVPGGPRIAVLRDLQGASFGVYLAGTEG
ncbi:VOC family protein [Kitasatospora sp. NPDC006697]|uniref:VOC family protein n=1 Tax=Kitasatospora sp. NPDC006697 TaxID=3364020 RepID=UPI0036ADD690